MKALIYNGKVEEVRETPFEVHPDMQWVDCDDSVEADDLYIDGQFVKPEIPATTYDEQRKAEYPDIRDQLDALWKGGAEADAMKEIIQAIKAKYPKSS